jgi:epoxyqueuosine reductase
MSALFPPELLRELGVLDWGYTEESKPLSYDRYLAWTEAQGHGPLNYLIDHRRELREDVRKFYPAFRSALVFLFSYQETKAWMLQENQHAVAGYSLGFGGEDYHEALRIRLKRLVAHLKEEYPDLEHQFSFDVHPVLERDLAHRAGLGWFGKNSMLINRREGSYFIIGSVLLNQDLPLDAPTTDGDHCGQCMACVEACPTDAIDPVSRTLRAKDCISTFTIELPREAKPPSGFEDSRGEIFGCDICQDVCPWNKKVIARTAGTLNLIPKFSFLRTWFFETPRSELYEKVRDFSGRAFLKALRGTPFARPGKAGWLKNLKDRS